MLDILIHNATVVTQDQTLGVLSRGHVGIHGGRIDRVAAEGGEDALPDARETIDAKGHILCLA